MKYMAQIHHGSDLLDEVDCDHNDPEAFKKEYPSMTEVTFQEYVFKTNFMLEKIWKLAPTHVSIAESDGSFFVEFENNTELSQSILVRLAAIADVFGYTISVTKRLHLTVKFTRL